MEILNIFRLCFLMVAGCGESAKRLLYKVKIKLSAPEDLDNNASNLQEFSYTTIKAATQNFSRENKLGEGGYGPVYKVTFGNCIHCLILCGGKFDCRVQILHNQKKKKMMSGDIKSSKNTEIRICWIRNQFVFLETALKGSKPFILIFKILSI